MHITEKLALALDENILSFDACFGIKRDASLDKAYILNTKCTSGPLFNGILIPRNFTIDNIPTLEREFRELKLPFSWWIEEEHCTLEIQNYFAQNNYINLGNIVGMALDVTTYTKPNEEQSILDNIQIKIIDNIKQFEEWLDVLSVSFEFGDDVKNAYIKYLSKYLGALDKFIPLGAYDGNKMVATASMLLTNKVAGFYNDATLPGYRNRGIATALYHNRLELCKKYSSEIAIIQTSQQAKKIANRVGFNIVKEYKLYASATSKS
ncbi:MAG: GNAT family N-acetyltransferase [Pseudomonadota bacterium]